MMAEDKALEKNGIERLVKSLNSYLERIKTIKIYSKQQSDELFKINEEFLDDCDSWLRRDFSLSDRIKLFQSIMNKIADTLIERDIISSPRDCTVLKSDLLKLIKGKWHSKPETPAVIPFTFQTSQISLYFRLRQYFGKLMGGIETLSIDNQESVRENFKQWEQACDNRVKFMEDLSNNPFKPKLVIAECARTSNVHGTSSTRVNSDGEIIGGFLCLHQTKTDLGEAVNAYNNYARLHEIGHALGISGHPHEISSIESRLNRTASGVTCSIMNYDTDFQVRTNMCRNQEYCGPSGLAFEPGPLDKELCSIIYSNDTQTHTKFSYLLAPGNVTLDILDITTFPFLIEGITFGFLKNFALSKSVLSERNLHAVSQIMNGGIKLYYFGYSENIVYKIIVLRLSQIIIESYDKELGKIAAQTNQLLYISDLASNLANAFENNDWKYLIYSFTQIYAYSGASVGHLFAIISDTVITSCSKICRTLTSNIGNSFSVLSYFFSKEKSAPETVTEFDCDKSSPEHQKKL